MEGNREKAVRGNRYRDRNGDMEYCQIERQNEYGIHVSFGYASGKVTHFMPNRVIPMLQKMVREVR